MHSSRRRFAARLNSGVSVHPLESPWLEQAMSEQRFDLGLSETQKAPVGVALQPLLKVNEVAVLPRDHSLCRKARLQPRDFTGERFISLAVGDPYRTAIDAMFEDAKVHRVTLLETTSAMAVCAMVRQGLGVAIVNPFTAMELSGSDLVVRPLTVAISYQVNMLLPEIAAPHPLQGVLADTVRKACVDLSYLDQCFY
ncbi:MULTISPECIES: LysR substrate-binding domain-containing protein [unclassified Acinetobacter]|uniref:LysR substrate-binding domain-containing protein n=1 Tax=unclassified Acinetobacter TaxID=196816 RepID=UPI00287D52E3|nr:LysR substrate-binding domain-containing protein [Acinetobacter sp. V104_13]MDS7955802.1 LysR substrate-binding domain-containing protein [Acinetobacter sp. V104_13]